MTRESICKMISRTLAKWKGIRLANRRGMPGISSDNTIVIGEHSLRLQSNCRTLVGVSVDK